MSLNMSPVDIEELDRKYDSIINSDIKLPTMEDCIKYKDLILKIYRTPIKTTDDILDIKRDYGFNEKNSYIFQMYNMLLNTEDSNSDIKSIDETILRNKLKIKKCKSHSGVLVITIFTSPYPEYYDEESDSVIVQEFTCHWNCAYCPNEPGQPRSYLKGEPGVLRANKNNFDCIKQMHDRMNSLYTIGHPVDKLEVIVLGGTWVSYPLKYREQFCRDMYYAANIYGDHSHSQTLRQRLSLQEEKEINKTAYCKVIGLTLETRPDTITPEELHLLRSYGCTRVQLGIQHLDDSVLNTINRRCPTEKTKTAIRLLKDCGFKVDAHWMPNLPGSSYELDKKMFIDTLLSTKKPFPKRYTEVLLSRQVYIEEYDVTNEDFQVDQWKVYPCSTVPWTDIEKWFKDGSYIPYDDEHLLDLVINIKTFVFPWIRLNRIIRDIPSDYIMNDHSRPNMRQDAKVVMEREGKVCACIRCREVKGKEFIEESCIIRIRKYNSSGGEEYFISAETVDTSILYGFLRLRLPSSYSNNIIIFPELQDSSLIRELHIYGQLQCVINKVSTSCNQASQHKGIGRLLVDIAEVISKKRLYKKVSIIAGEGTRGYYERLGYISNGGYGTFMMKTLV